MTEDTMIAALLREREGLVQRGLAERVAEVDEQLRLRGVTPPVDEKTEPTTPPVRSTAQPARATAPKGRRTRGTEKA
jgi:hypothetical protein